jgi:hypothetical protein
MRRLDVLACTLLALSAGCGRGHMLVDGVNQPPTVRLAAAVEPASGDRLSARLSWSGEDPDGRVDHFMVSTDLPSILARTGNWRRSDDRTRELRWKRVPGGALRPSLSTEGFELFAVRAVDDRGALSDPAIVAFFGEDIAPQARITFPVSSGPTATRVPPDVRIRWAGSDSDGPRHLPWEFKFRLIPDDDPDWQLVRINPDSLRRRDAPAFGTWDSLPGDSTGTWLHGLVIGKRYVFVVTALDREGGYDPIFTFDKNIVNLVGTSAQSLLPTITFPLGILLEVPAGVPLTVSWSATSPQGGTLLFRWALDVTPTDEHHRHGPTDFAHWSEWSAQDSVTLGPFASPGEHELYVETRDEAGLLTFAIFHIRVIQPDFSRDLLIVDDTRLPVDQALYQRPDTLQAPSGPWPNAAELDTFLYAVGGVRWRMTPNGTLSRPGLFHGYPFDTLGTRRGQGNPTIPLDFLGHYRHVIWIVDNYSALLRGSPTDRLYPETTLRFMSGPGRVNTLSGYVASGGHVWLLGGGAAYATLANGNNPDNDHPPAVVFSTPGDRPDLGPGDFMFDVARWQSEISVTRTAAGRISRDVHPAGALPSAAFPARLDPKSPATDPIFPNRSTSDFCGAAEGGIEWLSMPNVTGLPRNPSSRHAMDIPVLDTLYSIAGLPIFDRPPGQGDAGISPTMTYAHAGPGTLLFSGFDIWRFRRDHCQQLVDAVLQGVWGLNRNGVVATDPRGTGKPWPRPGQASAGGVR